MSIKIALAGNPNCGKTTLFNALTGSNQYVGNWPGVTVEKKEGKLKGAEDVIIQDLPGIYSLSPYTLEEVVARSYLVGETATVAKLHGEGPVKRRIMDMGITKGVEIYVRKVAPLGDPMELTVRNYELSVRKADAEMIEVV